MIVFFCSVSKIGIRIFPFLTFLLLCEFILFIRLKKPGQLMEHGELAARINLLAETTGGGLSYLRYEVALRYRTGQG